MGEFDFEVEYRPGYKRGKADALSRQSCCSFLFCREPRETECMAAFTSPETDVEDRWDTEPLGEAQRADGELRTMVVWLTASETRRRGKRPLGSAEVARDKERRVISALGKRRRATAEVAGDTADRSQKRGYAKGPLRDSRALRRTEDAGASTQASVLAGLA